jgi:hypothetical protein
MTEKRIPTFFALGVGFEPTMELSLTRLTVWTIRPTIATQEFIAPPVGLEPTTP